MYCASGKSTPEAQYYPKALESKRLKVWRHLRVHLPNNQAQALECN